MYDADAPEFFLAPPERPENLFDYEISQSKALNLTEKEARLGKPSASHGGDAKNTDSVIPSGRLVGQPDFAVTSRVNPKPALGRPVLRATGFLF